MILLNIQQLTGIANSWQDIAQSVASIRVTTKEIADELTRLLGNISKENDLLKQRIKGFYSDIRQYHMPATVSKISYSIASEGVNSDGIIADKQLLAVLKQYPHLMQQAQAASNKTKDSTLLSINDTTRILGGTLSLADKYHGKLPASLGKINKELGAYNLISSAGDIHFGGDDLLEGYIKPGMQTAIASFDAAELMGIEMSPAIARWINVLKVGNSAATIAAGDTAVAGLVAENLELAAINPWLAAGTVAVEGGMYGWRNSDAFRATVMGSVHALGQAGVTAMDFIQDGFNNMLYGTGFKKTVEDAKKISQSYADGYDYGVGLVKQETNIPKINEELFGEMLTDIRRKQASATFTMTAKQARKYIYALPEEPVAAPVKSQRKQNVYDYHKEVTSRYGPRAFDVSVPSVVPVMDNFPKPVIVQKGIPAPPPISKPEKNFFEKSSALYLTLKNQGIEKGKPGLEKALYDPWMLAKEIDKRTKGHLADDVLMVGRGVKSELLDVQEPQPATVSNRNIVTTSGYNGNEGKGITINIDKFFDSITINAEKVEQGYDQMEQKIVEVMLRVLQSANAIAE